MSSSSSSARSRLDHLNVQCGCGVRAPLRTAFIEPNVGRRFLGCVNQDKEDIRCNFFEWVDPPTCERGKDFGNWIVKKKMDLEKEIVRLRGKIRELQDKEQWFGVENENWKKKEQWYEVKINCMDREMKEMEARFEQRMEEWNKKEAWNELEMEELRVEMAELRVELEEEEAKNGWTWVMLEDVQPNNAKLRKRMNEMKEEIEFQKWVVKLLIALVVVLLGVGVVLVLAGKGMTKNKNNFLAILP